MAGTGPKGVGETHGGSTNLLGIAPRAYVAWAALATGSAVAHRKRPIQAAYCPRATG